MPTPKHSKIERDLENIKKSLAAEKRKWGAWDDSRGLRYLPPELYIKSEGWTAGLKYLKWFDKNFPDDIGMPEFLFEWAVILFKSGKHPEAERKVYQAFFSNTYLLDIFFGRSLNPIDKWEGSNLESPAWLQYFKYRSTDPALADFSNWLQQLIRSEPFLKTRDEFIRLNTKIKYEKDQEIRGYLLAQIRQLKANNKTDLKNKVKN